MTDRTRDRGAASVETAIVLALFIVPLLMGLVDVSRLLFTRIALQEAAQQGALFYAFEETATPAQVVSQVINSTDSVALAPADVDPECFPGVYREKAEGALVTVEVSFDVDLIFPLLTGPVTVARTAEAERFYTCNP